MKVANVELSDAYDVNSAASIKSYKFQYDCLYSNEYLIIYDYLIKENK